MTFTSAIERMHAIVEKSPQPHLPEQPMLAATNRELEKTYSEGGAPPDPEDLADIVERVSNLVHSGRTADIRRRDWRHIPWCLWSTEHRLADNEPVLSAYLGWLRSKNRWAHNTLVNNYLRDFDIDDPTFHRIGEELANAVKKFDTPWRERHQRFSLFSPSTAPQRIAEAALDENTSVSDVLDAAGLTQDIIYSGLGVSVYLSALQTYKETAANNKNPSGLFDRLSSWAVSENGFAFGAIRPMVAEAFLNPWINGDPDSQTDLVDKTRDFLLTHYNDPRLHPGGWNGVDEAALAVMKRWLVRASLRQFLDIVSDIASPGLQLQWPYRRAFWSAYERENMIADAWVIFAREGERKAKNFFEGQLPFGRFYRGESGVHSNHAVLLLKIGSLTIAEWSENGKCHIWRRGNQGAPQLYNDHYYRADVRRRSDNGGFIHGGSENGAWQKKVADWVHQDTNFRIKDYMPGSRR